MLPRSEKVSPSTLDEDLDALLLLQRPDLSRPREPAARVVTENAETGEDPQGGMRPSVVLHSPDRPKAERIAALAVALHSVIGSALDPGSANAWSGARARELLHAAALLHEVGLTAGEPGHHKHSYRIISSNGVPGLTRPEVEVVANVARYHRRGEPKLKHEPFAALPLSGRDLVSRLASILRVAIAIDRSIGVGEATVRAALADGALLLEVQSATGFAPEWKGIGKKTGAFFERAFAVALRSK